MSENAKPKRFYVDLDVRSTEVDRLRTVPMSVFFRYFEHLRLELGLDERFGLRPFWHAGSFFVVRDQHVAFLERVGMQRQLRLYIWVKKVGRSQVVMGQEAHDRESGAVIARSEVTVLWMNKDRRLSRIPNEARIAAESASVPPPIPVVTPVERPEAASSLVYPPKVTYGAVDPVATLPTYAHQPILFTSKVEVRPSDIDVYDHVNAAGYVSFCEDARFAKQGAAGFLPAYHASVRYLQEAIVGDQLVVRGWQAGDDAYGFEIRRGDTVLSLLRICASQS